MKKVYFDNAATTPVSQNVINSMTNCLTEVYGNPSSTHSFGRSAKAIVEQSRKDIAKQLGVTPAEIIFTSGGTEADNFALHAAVKDLKVTRIITSKIEHHAIGHTLNALQKNYDFQIDYVNIDTNGSINYTHLEVLLQKKSKKTLVSLMHVNNEIGNLLDLKKVSDLCLQYQTLFHSDTVQSIGHYDVNLSEINIDFCAVSAHKFHGPKGVGFAYIKKNTPINPLIYGGEQERGYRAGTESVHNIVGLTTAFKDAYANLEKDSTHIKALKAYFISEIIKAIPNVIFNGVSGHLKDSVYTIVSVLLPITTAKSMTLLFQLDLKGIACSQGSACQSGSSKGSHVLSEILTEDALQKPTLRFSFSKYNTKDEIDYVIEILKDFVKE